MADTTTQSKPLLSPYQEGIKKALKESGYTHGSEAMTQTDDPLGMAQHITQQSGLSSPSPEAMASLSQLLQLSKMKVDQPGTAQGPYAMLAGLLQGKMVNPLAPRQSAIGLDTAVKLQGAMQSGEKAGMDAKKFPLEINKMAGDIATQEQTFNQNTPEAKLQQIRDEEQIKADMKAEQESKIALNKEKLESEKTLNQVLNLNDNLVSTLKGAYEQQGGSGPIAGMIGNVKSSLGMANTGNIKALKAVKRDTAISYAKQLAGGARGVATLFKSVLDSLPDNSFSSEQAGTTIAELSLTAYALKKGISDLNLSQDQINNMSQSQLETLTRKEKNGMSQEEQDKIYSAIQDRFKNIAPRKSINLEGKLSGKKPTSSIPMQHQAPKGAKGWDDTNNKWVF